MRTLEEMIDELDGQLTLALQSVTFGSDEVEQSINAHVSVLADKLSRIMAMSVISFGACPNKVEERIVEGLHNSFLAHLEIQAKLEQPMVILAPVETIQ